MFDSKISIMGRDNNDFGVIFYVISGRGVDALLDGKRLPP